MFRHRGSKPMNPRDISWIPNAATSIPVKESDVIHTQPLPVMPRVLARRRTVTWNPIVKGKISGALESYRIRLWHKENYNPDICISYGIQSRIKFRFSCFPWKDFLASSKTQSVWISSFCVGIKICSWVIGMCLSSCSTYLRNSSSPLRAAAPFDPYESRVSIFSIDMILPLSQLGESVNTTEI